MFSWSFFQTKSNETPSSLNLSHFEACEEFNLVRPLIKELKEKASGLLIEARKEKASSPVCIDEKGKKYSIRNVRGKPYVISYDNAVFTITEQKHAILSMLLNYIDVLIDEFNQNPIRKNENEEKSAILNLACNLYAAILTTLTTHLDILKKHRSEALGGGGLFGISSIGVFLGTAAAMSSLSFSWPIVILAAFSADYTYVQAGVSMGIALNHPKSMVLLLDVLQVLTETIQNLDAKIPKERQLANFYEILEIPFGSSEEEVTKAYRKLALAYHPDKHKNLDNETKTQFVMKFIAITEACKILSNPQLKNLYDLAHGIGYRNTVPRLTC